MKLRNVNAIGHFILLGSILMLFIACGKNDEPDVDLPTIKTVDVSNVQYNQVTVTGSIASDGGGEIFERGICWSKESNPTTSDMLVKDATNESDVFSVDIKSLSSNRPFYVRAYAINSKGISYGEVLSFTLWLNEPDESLTDIDNNSYQTVRIGEQIWMKENLKATHYRNGDPITYITLQEDALWINTTSGGYCAYNDNLTNVQNYGYLYNGFAVFDDRSICPKGWHIPGKEEWQTLVYYLGGTNTAGNLLKSSEGWDNSNFHSNVLSGFTALPGGMRWHALPDRTYTEYWGIDKQTWFAASDQYAINGIDYMWYSNIMDESEWARVSDNTIKTCGHSIRCIKD